MATISFDPAAMVGEIRAFADVSKDFVTRASVLHLKSVATQLEQRTAEATTNAAKRRFEWGTESKDAPAPITTNGSSSYKGAVEGKPHKPLHATINFCWTCVLAPDGKRLIVDEGHVDVGLHATDDAEAKRKVVHYDVCFGGASGSAAHPPLHVQFHGFHNDVPRVPTFFVHPVDVLDFFLNELFQSAWRKTLASSAGRSKLRSYPIQQRHRFATYFGRYERALRASSGPALECFHAPLRFPYDLHTSGDAKREDHRQS